MKAIREKGIVSVLGIALAVYLAGWLACYLAWRRPEPSPPPLPPLQEPSAAVVQEPREAPVPEVPTPAAVERPAVVAPEDAGPIAVPQAPAGPVPAGIVLETGPTALACWDRNGLEYRAADCDPLDGLPKALQERLHVADGCRNESAGENAEGRLDLGMEIDFGTGRTGYWSNAASTIANAPQIAACLQQRLAGLPLGLFRPRNARYQYGLLIRFGKERPPVAAASSAPEKPMEELLKNSRPVLVVKDRVRLRRSPVDGQILGKISSKSQVLLLDRQDPWCLVKTPRGTVGWIVCWALEL